MRIAIRPPDARNSAVGVMVLAFLLAPADVLSQTPSAGPAEILEGSATYFRERPVGS